MNTRYPILLVLGLGTKDVLFIKSCGSVDRILRIQGYTVFKSRIDAFGSVQTNAAQLKEEVLSILEQTGAEKVNLIAHSKGGLDAKQMLLSPDMAEKVASLTTLCTPHRGSPIASFILKLPRFLVRIAVFWINLFWRILGDRQPDSLAACMDLQRVEHWETETVKLAEGVLCQSFSASLQPGKADFVMAIPPAFSRFIEKDAITDGVVPQDSAIFGEYRGDCVDASVSHTEIVDFMVYGEKKDKILAFYSRLCEELALAGL